MNAQQILHDAANCIGSRAAERDQAQERSMARTVNTFNALTGRNLSEKEGWQFMAILKMARSMQGEERMDDYVDGAAYIALAGECAASKLT